MTSYVCRFCCSQKIYDDEEVESKRADFLPLFTSINNVTQQTLAEMANHCTKIKLNQDDGLPEMCCWQCIIKLQVAHEFASLALRSQQMLREWQKEQEIEWHTPKKQQLLHFLVPQISLKVVNDQQQLEESSIEQPAEAEQSEDVKHTVWLDGYQDDVETDKKRAKSDSFLCSRCPAMNYTRSKAIAHERVHTDERPFACKICSGEFKLRSALTAHYKNVHRTVAPTNTSTYQWKCNICEKYYGSEALLQQHLTTHTSDFPFDCKDCACAFDDRDTFTRHLRDEHGKMQRDIDEIIDNFDPKPLKHQCPHCQQAFDTRASLLLHLPTHSSKTRFPCPDCPKSFNHKRNLKKHIVVKHNNQNESPSNIHIAVFQCVICMGKFPHRHALADHVRSHTGAQPFGCGECPRRFPTKSGLRRHLLDVHHIDKEAIKNIVVDSKHEQLLLNQQQMYHLFRLLDRQLQLKLDTNKNDLKEEVSGVEERSYEKITFQCMICDSLFEKRACLIEHLETHATSEAAAYSCKICSKHFHLRTNLRHHMSEEHISEPALDEEIDTTNVEIDEALSQNVQQCIQYVHEKSKTPSNDDATTTCVCFVCDAQLALKEEFERHMIEWHMQSTYFKCRLCSFETTGDASEQEMRMRPIVAYAIHFFSTHTTLTACDRTCFACFKVLHSSVMLMVHLRVHYSDEYTAVNRTVRAKGLHMCPFCDKTYKNTEKFRDHKNAHLPEELRPSKDHLCPNCGRTFFNKAGLDHHLRRKHANGEGGDVEERYMTVHDAIEIFKKLKADGVLDQHGPLNDAVRGYTKCPFCAKTFDLSCKLGKHLRTHIDERPYKCTQCSRAFRLNIHLFAHVNAHQGKKINCSECSKQFTRIGCLRKHQKEFHSGATKVARKRTKSTKPTICRQARYVKLE